MSSTVFDAAYRLAHEFPAGGAMGLARVLGQHPGVFLNKINPAQERHRLSLNDVVAMSVASGDARIVQALCWVMGGFFVARPSSSGSSDLELLTLWLQKKQKDGVFAGVVERCYADGDISEADWQEIRAAGMLFMGSFLDLLYRFEGLKHG